MGVDEILVHLAAPSSRGDDRRFRAMAEAYKNFACLSVTKVYPKAGDQGNVAGDLVAGDESMQDIVPSVRGLYDGRSEDYAGQETALSATTPHYRDACTFIDDTQLAAAAVESQLWPATFFASETESSPLAGQGRKRRRLSGPESQRRVRGEQQATAEKSSRHEPSSTASAAAPSSPVHYSSSNEGPEGEHAVHPHGEGQGQRAAPEPGGHVKVPLPSLAQKSTAPPTFTAEPTSSGDHSDGHRGALRGSQASTTAAQPAVSSTHKEVPARHLEASPSATTPTSAPAKSKLSRYRITPAAPSALPVQPTDPFNGLPTTITPLPPPIALNPSPSFNSSPALTHYPNPTDPTHTTLLPPTLTQLMHLPHLSTKYRSRFTARPIRDMERGYWRVDVGPWLKKEDGVKAVREFWTNLESFVGRGRAGWGVCIVREVGEVMGTAEGSEGGARDRNASAVIRIYSFGLTVPHLYLLMYVFSKSLIRKLHAPNLDVQSNDARKIGRGVEWVDAGGAVVLRM